MLLNCFLCEEVSHWSMHICLHIPERALLLPSACMPEPVSLPMYIVHLLAIKYTILKNKNVGQTTINFKNKMLVNMKTMRPVSYHNLLVLRMLLASC